MTDRLTFCQFERMAERPENVGELNGPRPLVIT